MSEIKAGSYVKVTIKTKIVKDGKESDLVVSKVGIISDINDETYGVHVFQKSEVKPVVYTQVNKDAVKLV